MRRFAMLCLLAVAVAYLPGRAADPIQKVPAKDTLAFESTSWKIILSDPIFGPATPTKVWGQVAILEQLFRPNYPADPWCDETGAWLMLESANLQTNPLPQANDLSFAANFTETAVAKWTSIAMNFDDPNSIWAWPEIARLNMQWARIALWQAENAFLCAAVSMELGNPANAIAMIEWALFSRHDRAFGCLLVAAVHPDTSAEALSTLADNPILWQMWLDLTR